MRRCASGVTARASGLQWADIDFDQATLVVGRASQRRSWRHGCQRDPCGLQAWRCPKRHSGGLVTDSPRSATSIRTVALPPGLVEALATHQRAQEAERAAAGTGWASPPPKDCLNSGTGWVFATDAGKPISPKDDWRELEGAVGRCRSPRRPGPRRPPHRRHLQLVAGIHPRTVMGVLGGSHPLLLMRYQHVVDDLQREAVQRIEQLIWPPSPPGNTPRP